MYICEPYKTSISTSAITYPYLDFACFPAPVSWSALVFPGFLLVGLRGAFWFLDPVACPKGGLLYHQMMIWFKPPSFNSVSNCA